MARIHSKKRRTEQTKLSLVGASTAIYIRVSTHYQVEEGYSLDAQHARLEGYCISQEWSVDEQHVYVDGGLSAKGTDRPAFQSMMDAARRGDLARVVVIKLDRLTRNVEDAYRIANELRELGVSLVSIAENFDLSTPTGEAMFGLMAVFAQWERKQIGERVKSGMTEKATQGGYNGGPAPFGYQYQDGAFVVVEDQAETVRDIYTLFLNGESLRGVAAHLNAMGARTQRGGQWYPRTISKILDNGRYAGLAQWNGVETEDASETPPIIDLEVYQAAGHRLRTLRRGRPTK